MEPRDDLVYKFIQLFIGLATGALTISISIIANKEHLPASPFLVFGWGLLVISILLGVFAHSSMIGLYEAKQKEKEDAEKIERRRTLGKNIATGQFWIGSLGLICFFIYGVIRCVRG